jgi:hypothetical protein
MRVDCDFSYPGITNSFWKWRSFPPYLRFFGITMGTYALIYSIFGTSSTFLVEATGMLSQICDGLVAFPQLYTNCAKQSVRNLR